MSVKSQVIPIHSYNGELLSFNLTKGRFNNYASLDIRESTLSKLPIALSSYDCKKSFR